jgi:hypothetical protein
LDTIVCMRVRLLVTLLSGTALLAACSSADPVDGGRCGARPCRDGGGDVPGDSVVDAPEIDTGDPRARELETIAIEPADVVLMASPAMPRPMQAFRVVGRRRDGTMADGITGVWSLASTAMGDIDATGVFTANGEVGGETRVSVSVAANGGELRAETSINVTLRREIVVEGAPADAATRFAAAPVSDSARAATIVYPLNGAVMPQNVFPADIQWLNGNAGDLFRVRLRKPRIEVVAYVLHTGAAFNFDWLVEQRAWRSLAQTDVSEPMEIAVDRWDSMRNDVVAGPTVSMRFANGAVSGTIYYWDIAAGRAIRIDDGTNTRQNFMPSPPPALDDRQNCVGCHAVSRDGHYFAGRLGGGANNTGVVFDLTRDLTGNPAPTLYPVNNTARWTYASFNPDSTRLVIDQQLALRLLDPMTGTTVPVGGMLPSARSTQPTWSPDGRRIAFITDVNSSWGGEFTSGNLAVLDVTGPDTFGPSRTLHTGSSLASAMPGGNADSYPSWTPDSQWLAFSHGTVSRSDTGQGALYLINAAGGTAVRLDRACGGASTTDNFFPNFSPFDSGGYFWLSFLSRRDYGNERAGTRGRGLQQIWVAAVRRNPDGRTDPSEVAYWLPGQNTRSRNISAFWAPRPCRRDGEMCSVGTECCSGICRDNRCQPPPSEMCRMRDQLCGGAGCCAGLMCIGNVCQVPPG